MHRKATLIESLENNGSEIIGILSVAAIHVSELFFIISGAQTINIEVNFKDSKIFSNGNSKFARKVRFGKGKASCLFLRHTKPNHFKLPLVLSTRRYFDTSTFKV